MANENTQAADCDGAIRNIEKEILRECNNRSMHVYQNFLNYYIKLLTLDPSWGIFSNFMTNRVDVQNFIKFVVTKLQNQLTPCIIVLKMQYYFRCNFNNKSKMVRSNRVELSQRLKLLENDIIDMKEMHTDEEIEVMCKRIVFYICFASGLGSPFVEPVFKEVRTAFGSIVIDEDELREFAGTPRYMKEDMLQEYVQLVTGVRIFNKDCGKGGEGMEDLPKLIKGALVVLNTKLQNNLLEIMNVVNFLTTALDYAITVVSDERELFRIEYNLPNDYNIANLTVLKEFLIIYRQVEVYLRTLINEVARQEIVSESIFEKMQSTLVSLHQIVKHRIAIPVEEVFPSFLHLFEIHCAMQDQTILLAKLTQIMNNVLEYAKLTTFEEHLAQALIPRTKVSMTDGERISRSSIKSNTIPQLNETYELREFDEDTAFNQLHCLGFCPWTLMKSDGTLIPGNPNFGIMLVFNMQFVFASPQAGIAFGNNAKKSVMNLISFIRKRPELITLLRFKDQVTAVQEILELVHEPPLRPITAEIDTQTDTHFVEKNIDKQYFWNVWDLKRQALKLANLTHCMTVSSQTMKSFHRLGIHTQTYDKKEQTTQTKKDNYTNVPTPSNFIYGLRGRKDNKQFIIELTRPVKE